MEGNLGACGAPPRLLLHGVTGSGKTEVYLRAVAAALERGGGDRARARRSRSRPRPRAGSSSASATTSRSCTRSSRSGERYDEWWRLRRGEARVCVGPRSAVFAPFEDLGLIVVDEEHDGSYKQEGDPRYDARGVAERRAADEGAVLSPAAPRRGPRRWSRYERIGCP